MDGSIVKLSSGKFVQVGLSISTIFSKFLIPAHNQPSPAIFRSGFLKTGEQDYC
jgi:hypothetical protein